MNTAVRLRVEEYAAARAQAHPVQVERALRRGLRAYWLRLTVTYAVVSLAVVLLAAVPFLAAASETDPPSESFSVTPAELTVEVGERQQLTVAGPSGEEVSEPVRWSSADPSVAEVDDSGLVVGRGQGLTEVTARLRGSAATAAVVVTPVGATGLRVTPEQATLAVGERQQLTAARPSGDDVSGSVQWSSADPSVARVDDAGLVVGAGAGSTTITAQAGDDRATVGVVVTARPETGIEIVPQNVALDVGERQQLTAARPSGDEVSGSVQWSSADPSVARVDDAGLVVGAGAGSTTITAQAGDDRATVGVVVTARPETGIEIVPQNVALDVGERQQLTAARPSGDEVSGSVQWSSADPSVARVDDAGLVVGAGAGSTTITAQAGDDRATVGVVVTARPETGIEIAPRSIDVDLGGQVRMTAVRPSGEDVTESVRWSSADPSVAEVTTTGVVVGRGQGKTTITARLGEDQVTAGVSVRTTVRGVSVTPAAVQTCLQFGDRPQLGAEATYTDGREEDVTDGAVWTSDDRDVAVVDGGGQLTFTGGGTTTIRATFGGAQGTANVQVEVCEE